MKSIKTRTKTLFSVIALTALTAPAFAADFTTLDVNADGQVDFKEYKAVALKEGKTVTLAAQEFTRMAQGDAILTQDEFFLADALGDQPYALQPSSISEPMPYEATETVNQVETFESFPEQVEAIEPPVVVEETPEENITQPIEGEVNMPQAPVVIEKPLEVPPVVAGEIETSDDLTNVTPVEEGVMDLPDVETETDVVPELDFPDVEIETPEDLIKDTDIKPDDIY